MKLRKNPDKTVTIYGKSSETKPEDRIESHNLSEGDTFYEEDTSTVFMWDGSQWLEQ